MKTKINTLVTLLGMIWLVPQLGYAIPKPDVYVSILPNESNGKESLGAYQDSEISSLWYFLPLSFEIENQFYPDLNQTLPSFIHSFYDRLNPPHSVYQFVFVPIRYSDAMLSKLKTKIATYLSTIKDNTVTLDKITLTTMPLTRLSYNVDLVKSKDPSKRQTEYIDLFGKNSENTQSVSIAQLYGGIPVELIVDGQYEPNFSERLTHGVNAGLPEMGQMKLAFKGQFQLIDAHAVVNYQKLFEFAERKWTDREVSGHWYWKKERFIERTKVELTDETLNSGIKYNVKIDETLEQSVREMSPNGQLIDKPLHQYVLELLAQEITKRAFDVQAVMQGQDEVYRVSERPGTKSLKGEAKVDFDTSLIREVQVSAVFMMTHGLRPDMLDPRLAKYFAKKDGGQ